MLPWNRFTRFRGRPGARSTIAPTSAAKVRDCSDYATWAAIAEQHGLDWRDWPTELRRPSSPAVAAFRDAHPATDRLPLLAAVGARRASWAPRSGRPRAPARRSGSCTIWRSGCTPAAPTPGACRTCSPRACRSGPRRTRSTRTARTGRQPPWRPDRLAEVAYAPFRDLVSTVLRHSGGVRVDHIIGLFRLWWVPAGRLPTAGTYVRYDHEALIGILALEAARSPALVVGEDLGRRRAVRARLPARTGHPRHLDPVVRVRARRGWGAAAAGVVAGVLPRLRHHPRPAAECGLSRRRARPAPARAGAADPAARRGTGRRRRRTGGLAGQPAAPAARCRPTPTSRPRSRPCTVTSPGRRPACCASR